MQLLNNINANNLKGDWWGGLTAAIIALPMALTFGVASGAGPEAGLWGAVLVGLFAALFGGTPTLISEPTGPMTVVMTAVIANLTASNPENGMAMAFTVVMMAGVFQILLGLLRLGRYITQMPYTVISGFMSGIGFILIVLQLGPALGQKGPPGGVLGTLQNLPQLLAGVKPLELLLAAITVAILWLWPQRIKKYIPPQVVALVFGTILSLTLVPALGSSSGMEEGIRRIGEISAGLPSLQIPVFGADELGLMLADAAVLGALGCIDALLTSVVADSLTRTEHNSNKELVGQGLGNLVSGLFGGIAGAGATMGTVANIQTGARSALSGIIRAVILMVAILAVPGLVAPIPMAVLAGIALKVGFDIVDWGFLKRAHRISLKGALILYVVIGLTVLWDLIVAVGVGVFVANMLTIDRLSRRQSDAVKSISTADDDLNLPQEEKALLDAGEGRVLLFQLTGDMIFGVAKTIAREHNAIGQCKAIVFDLGAVSHLGVTTALAVENAVEEAVKAQRHVYVVGAVGTTRRRLEALKLFELLPADHTQLSRAQALAAAVEAIKA
ncbi:MAG: SulP family inorganic anion transporter [Synechococcus sp. SB0662_bin_45]|uniref:SulP family inorganic anion transporter n=1 Tax=Synechococcus sp. SB0676_bin_10 TaxID=2604869 RepID=A0A6B1F601_9SYNE|nr:SulP family inorganic anion transporter [Cyanobacteria bacterium MAG IRC3_bin_20]MDE0648387.1 SulP family inorganic anion transporter [Cyanobacteria bacterium MAG IRC4_bin_6]MXW11980.1 SulP family inorganic anion transporter [Synechococcus sp. SB0668_bin_13]MXY18453.1 SulP family inorganic anion transporter [Synechococcus sp. SB0664_bin_36]MYE20918.1 SulP family inorganic anion transporter [Synechococcus sp. SB0662_bin_45]MYG38179.1 SulP family inorganic anion transporter [Synechococcus sp.